jgi:hypothetical protein
VSVARVPRKPRAAPRRAAGLYAVLSLLIVLFPRAALAQDSDAPRDVSFEWDVARRRLFVDVAFRDAVDTEIRRKLDRGLPTTIVMTGAVYRVGQPKPVSTTVQTCKITWHVWEEVYYIERTRPNRSLRRKSVGVDGVLRDCAQASELLAGTSEQVPSGVALYVKAIVQINPLSAELLQKIKRWVNRPSGTGTAGPGDALFSTFTGLFLQRLGDAERELKFTTKSAVPTVRKRRTRQ